MTNETDTPVDPKQNHDSLTAEIQRIQQEITAFNTHWLNHKHLVNGFAVMIMAFIFLGMLVTTIELIMWSLCGVSVVALICVMAYRSQKATKLNAGMETARKALKEYERGRRKKKK